MAVKLKSDTFYTKKPDQIYLKELAREVNSIPLSNIPDNPQILLPPPEHALIRNNFQVFSEEILQNLSNENKQETSDTKLEDELKLSTTKRHSMIGLKRRDYDDRPNVVLSKKKMRLSAISHNEGGAEFSQKGNYEDSSHTQSHTYKPSNNIHNQKGSSSHYPPREEHDDNIFDHEEEDEMMHRHGNFLQGDGSDMEDYNYDNFS
jgi:hypothetical protein